jgi:hypothetical protein
LNFQKKQKDFSQKGGKMVGDNLNHFKRLYLRE